MPELEIDKTFRFESAHRLTGVPATHKCSALHGHSYEVRVYLRGSVNPQTGFVMDFGDLTKVCDPVFKQLDHTVLNDLKGLENPTSENMSVWLWKKLKPQLPLLYQITIKETESSSCSYRGEYDSKAIHCSPMGGQNDPLPLEKQGVFRCDS